MQSGLMNYENDAILIFEKTLCQHIHLYFFHIWYFDLYFLLIFLTAFSSDSFDYGRNSKHFKKIIYFCKYLSANYEKINTAVDHY